MGVEQQLGEALRPLVLAWLFCFGACVGSFLNVVIFRLPRECMSVFFPRRSFCPRCGRQLTWHDNIPVLGWLWLRGRCAGCAGKISPRYPLVELFTGLLFLWLGWQHLTPAHVLDPTAWGVVGIHALAGTALIVCTGIDFDHRIIPDEVDVPGLLLAPPLLFLVPAALPSAPLELGPIAGALREALASPCGWWGIPGFVAPLVWLETLPARDPALSAQLAACASSLVGAGCGAGLVWGLGEVFRRLLDPDSMGFGDVKLAAFLGALVGPQGLLSLLLVAVFAGSLVGVASLLWTGRSAIRPRELLTPEPTADAGARDPRPGRRPLSAAQRRWLRRAVAPGALAGASATDDAPLPLRPGGALLARLITGDPTIAFGPFLCAGAAAALYFPRAVPDLLRWWST